MLNLESRKKRFKSLVEKHRTSNMTITDFCIKHNIPKCTFGYWRKKVLLEQPSNTKSSTSIPSNAPAFMPVTIGHTPVEEKSENIEIYYPSGINISLPTSYNIANLRLLLSDAGSKS